MAEKNPAAEKDHATEKDPAAEKDRATEKDHVAEKDNAAARNHSGHSHADCSQADDHAAHHHAAHHHAAAQPTGPYRAAVITVSDRASAGVYEDATGPAVAALLAERGYEVERVLVVPDERGRIEAALRELAARDVALVLTCGGTGLSPRDVTPEATEAVCDRMVPGIGEAMRAASMRVTDRACLSRATAGTLGRTLVVNLPGSPRAATENLEVVVGALGHGLETLRADGPVTCG